MKALHLNRKGDIMAKKIHVYDITVSTGEVFKNVEMKGPISSIYSGIANDFIPVENEDGQTVELTKYQVVKAVLVKVEE